MAEPSDYDRHSTDAEQLLARASDTKHGTERQQYLLDAAAVHATLALAAATWAPFQAVKHRQAELDAAFMASVEKGLPGPEDRK